MSIYLNKTSSHPAFSLFNSLAYNLSKEESLIQDAFTLTTGLRWRNGLAIIGTDKWLSANSCCCTAYCIKWLVAKYFFNYKQKQPGFDKTNNFDFVSLRTQIDRGELNMYALQLNACDFYNKKTKDKVKLFPGHVLTVIQFPAYKKDLELFQVVQSYLDKYSLKEHFERKLEKVFTRTNFEERVLIPFEKLANSGGNLDSTMMEHYKTLTHIDLASDFKNLETSEWSFVCHHLRSQVPINRATDLYSMENIQRRESRNRLIVMVLIGIFTIIIFRNFTSIATHTPKWV